MVIATEVSARIDSAASVHRLRTVLLELGVDQLGDRWYIAAQSRFPQPKTVYTTPSSASEQRRVLALRK